MTAQTPERIIVDGKPRALYAEPLYRLLKSRRIELQGYCSSCWRGYVGTWEVIGGRLYLVHINFDGPPAEDMLRLKLLRAASATQFPVFASWFNGRLRIQIGRRLIYSHHGWSSWFERERVMTFKQGVLVRDREVDTRRILEWWLRRNPEARERLDPDIPQPEPGPLIWFEPEGSEEEDNLADWWPPDYARP